MRLLQILYKILDQEVLFGEKEKKKEQSKDYFLSLPGSKGEE